MQTIKTWVCIAILFVCAFSSGWAQGGPPLVTDDTETPGNKKWEICIAGTSERRYPDEQRFEAPLLDINYGVGKNLELNYQLPLLVTANRNESGLAGLGDSEVGIKWRFLDEDKKNVAMSVFPQFTFNNPTSSVRRGLAENDQRFFLPFELQKSLGPFGINFEAGPSFHFNTPDEWESGVALSHSFGDLEVVGEIHDTVLDDFQKDDLIFNVGLRYQIKEGYSLLFSVGRSIYTYDTPVDTLLSYAGVQFSF